MNTNEHEEEQMNVLLSSSLQLVIIQIYSHNVLDVESDYTFIIFITKFGDLDLKIDEQIILIIKQMNKY